MVGPPAERGQPFVRRTRNLRLRPIDPHPPGSWPAARAAARRLISPVERFLSIEAVSGIVLLAAALVALVWANSPWRSAYEACLHTPIGLRVGGFAFERDAALLGQRRAHGRVLLRRRAGDQARAARGRAQRPCAGPPCPRSPRWAACSFRRASTSCSTPARPPQAAGAFRWRPTSHSRSGSSRCSESACRPRCGSCSSRSPSSTTWARSSSSRSSIRRGVSVGGLAVAAAGILLILLMQKLGVRSPWAYVLRRRW